MQTKVTKADLALIDAALKLRQYSPEALKAGVAVDAADPEIFPLIAFTLWLAEGAVFALEYGRIPFIGDTLPEHPKPIFQTNASLEELIAARDRLAKRLGEK